MKRRIRVLVAKPGLDGHDKGAKVICQLLRDAGMEVIYSGLHKSVQEIVKIACEEDVDIIGLSILSGAHLSICERLFATLNEMGVRDKKVIVGGVIPREDWDSLRDMGVSAIFPMNTPFEQIVSSINQLCQDAG
jgi:methylmalonyl-CoA mutase C-terminal domain/subunit